MSNPRDIECRRCNDTGYKVGTYELCPCTTGSNEYAQPLLVQCTERESGGVQCEVLLVAPDEEHAHWISQETIDRHLDRPFYTHISVCHG